MQDELKEFLESLKDLGDRTGMVDMLIAETLEYRDMLQEQTGDILTVGDARASLDALEEHLRDQDQTVKLTTTQQVLYERWKKALPRLEQGD